MKSIKVKVKVKPKDHEPLSALSATSKEFEALLSNVGRTLSEISPVLEVSAMMLKNAPPVLDVSAMMPKIAPPVLDVSAMMPKFAPPVLDVSAMMRKNAPPVLDVSAMMPKFAPPVLDVSAMMPKFVPPVLDVSAMMLKNAPPVLDMIALRRSVLPVLDMSEMLARIDSAWLAGLRSIKRALFANLARRVRERYHQYLNGGEPLPSAVYACISLLELFAGSRRAAAHVFGISLPVLRRMGYLSSEVGDFLTARKFTPWQKLRPHTKQEVAWLESTMQKVVARVEDLGDGAHAPALITMADLPRLAG